MPFCRKCGSEMAEDDRFCNTCGATADGSGTVAAGSPTAEAGTTGTGGSWMAGQVLALVGFVMLAIGPFMAWATAGIFSASGMQKTGNEAIALVVLAVVGIVLGVLSIANKKSILSIIPLIAAVIALAMTIFYYVQLHNDLSGLENEFFSAGIGGGIYLCLVGGALGLVGSIIGGFKRKRG